MAKKSLVLQRSRWDIMATVLETAKNPESKTHVMYRANLSFRQLERYLELLLEKGFLKASEGTHSRASRLFVTTDRGHSFLAAYHRLEEIVSGKKAASTFGFP